MRWEHDGVVDTARILDLVSLLCDLPYWELDRDWQEVLHRFLSTFGFSFGFLNIAKPQVKRVMEKTNTNIRVQLVRLAHHVNVPISSS
ncbi:hypothetical protein DYI21_19075 [Thalassospira tepidiphila]|nr:hypothetical protein [Thalassospira tepidiphila]